MINVINGKYCIKKQSDQTMAGASNHFQRPIFKPPCMWIDGTIFNINDSLNQKDVKDPKENECFNIITNETEKSSTKFRLPTEYYKRLFHQHKQRIKRIQEETSTNINIPKDGDVIITGNNFESVAESRAKLHLLFSDIRNELRPVQFIAIPTLNDGIKNRFSQFKDEILLYNKTARIDGLDESIFLDSQKLHLTLEVFSLLDDVEINEAIKQLNNCKTEVICPLIKDRGPIIIKLKGVNIMNENGNKNKVNVLYTEPQFSEENVEFCMQKVANNIADYFYDKGLVKNHKDGVKLHVTLMNTKYRKEEGPKWRQRKIRFDASYILEKYKDYDFGECIFDTVHLCLMSSVGDDGFYKTLSTIQF